MSDGNFLRAILDGLGAAVLVGNRDRVLIEANRRACELLGYPREELVGMSIDKLHTESEMGLFRGLYSKALAGEPYTVQYQFVGKDGRRIPVELRCEHVEADGEPLMVAFVLETTEREAMLRQVVKQERAAAVATLSEGVAHEFNNLLARILACAENAAEHASVPSVRRDLETIIETAETAGTIAQRLLSYARRQPPSRRKVSLISIVEQSLQILEDDLTEAHIEVVRDFEPLPDMMLDNGQIGQVVMNLISNAHDAMPKGGCLTISIRRDGGEAVMRFMDTGGGIPPEILNELFKPFVTTKGARSRSEVPGMGLGLCVCDGIIASHGGTIMVESSPGKGSTFTIRLPLGEAKA